MATQGRHGSTDWVSAYILLYSDTGRVWKQYMLEDNVGVGVCFLGPFYPAHFAEITVCALSQLLHGCLSYKKRNANSVLILVYIIVLCERK